jgi:hypothetical protein
MPSVFRRKRSRRRNGSGRNDPRVAAAVASALSPATLGEHQEWRATKSGRCGRQTDDHPIGGERTPRKRVQSRGHQPRALRFYRKPPANARAGATDAERETVEGSPSPSFFFCARGNEAT